MKIIQAIPRRMRFEAVASSSVELCVSEWVSGSRYRGETTVFAEASHEAALLDVDIFRLPPARRFTSWRLGQAIHQQVAAKDYRLIVTQQHIATAARIAAFNSEVPVILQTHNFIDPPRRGLRGALFNAVMYRRLASLSGITLVSQATLRQFESDWPRATLKRCVISNGFDFSTWKPQAAREKTIMVVGRTNETKGILEAAQAIAGFQQDFPDWRGILILSDARPGSAYFESVRTIAAGAPGVIEILTAVPFARVKEISESAAISIVASKWREPFGRTALEAHAGGAALISSGTGGLREISGESALFVEAVTGEAIARQLAVLASDPGLRDRLAQDGMARVRRLFALTQGSGMAQGATPICQRLDDFYDSVSGARRGSH